MLTQERLKQLLYYDLDTGVWCWMTTGRGRRLDRVAGCANAQGYWVIRVDDVLYYAHRLAVLYATGNWPPDEVDHRYTGLENREDSRLGSIRFATRAQNAMNVGVRSNNTSGYKGVSYDKRRDKWVAEGRANCVRFRLGRFDTLDEAAEAYRKFAEIHHREFARTE